MKTLLKDLSVFLLIVVLGITGCAAPATQTQPPPTQPPAPEATEVAVTNSLSDVVLKMAERMNAGNVEGSLEYFADDAMAYIIGLPPTGMEVYAGKEQIRTLWQDSVANHFQWEVNITGVEGNIVYVQSKTWHDFTRQLGVAPLEYNDVYEIKDGKIITYGTTITADALARFKPAFAEVVPSEEPAVPSNEQPVSAMTVTIAGGTCMIDNPAPLQAGEIKVTLNVKDQNKDLYALTLFNLGAGKDFLDLMASTAGMPPSWADMLVMEELEPDKSETYTFTVEKGPVYLICWSKPPDLPIGNAGPIAVQEVSSVTALQPALTLPPAEATITFEGNACAYEGPQPIPANMTFTVNWYVNSSDGDLFGLYVFIVGDGMTKEDLAAAIKREGAPPSWLTQAGSFDAGPNSSQQVTVKTAEGPLFGPLYFACFFSESGPFRLVGPIDVE